MPHNTLTEHPIYGTSRLGVYKRKSKTSLYQLTDHLGNVRAVIAKKGSNAAALVAKTDYYPGGMAMPNKNVKGDYRYNYQGQEQDEETGHHAFELRMYDSRINRWLSPDPAKQYPSPYLSMGNNWISRIDPDGGEDDWVSKDGKNFYWDESITSSSQAVAKGLIYGGATKSEVLNNFGNTGWSKFIFGSGLNFNDQSFFDAKFSLVSRKAILAEKDREVIPLTEKQIQENKTLWPDDKHEPTLSNYNISIDFLKDAYQDQNFEFSMKINEKIIFGDAAYSRTNKNLQFITNVLEGKYVPQQALTGHYNRSLLLGNSTKTGVIIINFRNQQDYHSISNFIYK